MTPASWREMTSEFEDECDLVDDLVCEVAKDPNRGTLVLFAEFAIDVQTVGGQHRLGLYAAKDAPSWVNAQFAFDLLHAVHDTLATGASCRCMRDVTIVTRDTECN